MLVGANDGGVDDQILEVLIVRHRREDTPPHLLAAPPAEPPEGAVPRSEHLRQVTPRRSRPDHPQHRLHEHPIVTARRTARPLIPDDVPRHPLPLIVAKNEPIQRTHGWLQKTALNQNSAPMGIPRVHTT